MRKFIVTLVLAILNSNIYRAQELPVIDVYVESLCPDSVDFIAGSFKQFFENKDHEKLAVVNFYNFGNAKETWTTDHYEFTCQHGPNECYGNVLETCSLSYLSKHDGDQFELCMYENILKFEKNVLNTFNFCLNDKSTQDKILKCVSSQEGNDLEHAVAQKTPPHNYVPWLQFNGEHDVNIENRLLSNMLEYLCSLPGREEVEGCKDTNFIYSNEISNKQCINSFDFYDKLQANLQFLQ